MSNEEEKTIVEEQTVSAQTAEEQTETVSAEERSGEPSDTAAEEQAVEAEADGGESLTVAEKTQKQSKPAKAVRASGPITDLSKSKIFKWVYYPVLALFVALMFVFSVIDGVYGYKPDAYDAKYFENVDKHIAALSESSRSAMSSASVGESGGINYAREYIVKTLADGGFTNKAETRNDDNDTETVDKVITTTDWAGTVVEEATVTKQTSDLTAELQQEMGLDKYLVGATVTNVIAAVPSVNKDRGAVIITVRYDSRPDTVGAADNAAFVANMLETLIRVKADASKLKNDLVVVFTEELDAAFGSYVFFDAFEGLGNVVARARYGINLDAYGNAGTLAITNVSNADYGYINAVTGVAGTAFESSILPDSMDAALVYGNAVGAFGKIPALQIAVVGGLDAAQSSIDKAENISESVLHQQAAFVKEYIGRFGAESAKYGTEGGENAVFFSYFEGAVVYSAVAAYVIGALLVALIAGTIVAMAIKKTFSVKKMFLSLGMELLIIASTLAVTVAAYFLISLLLTGFGVIPIHAITRVHTFNAGILIAAMIISLASVFGFTNVYKKLFRVTSSDAVRGNAMLFAMVGAIMSFACPAYSFITVWTGVLMLAVMLVSVFFQTKFKAAFGIGLDRLYLYLIPVALTLPIVMANIAMLSQTLPLVLLPVIMILFTGLLSSAVPYLDRTQKLLDAVAKKLPMRTIRVERTVTERVEDRAKKGKYTEQTVKRIEKEKIERCYKNYLGITVVSIVGVLVAIFSGMFGMSFGTSSAGYIPYENAIYNDALVYEWIKDSSGSITQQIVVDDLTAYKYVRYSVSDLEWDGTRYVKQVNYASNSIVNNAPSVIKDNDGDKDIYSFNTFDGSNSHVTITIPSASAITKITVKEQSKNFGDYKGYVYEFENVSSITLRLPYGIGNFIMEFEGAAPTRFEYEEHRTVAAFGTDNQLDNLDEWNRFRGDYSKSEFADLLRGGIVIKTSLSV